MVSRLNNTAKIGKETTAAFLLSQVVVVVVMNAVPDFQEKPSRRHHGHATIYHFSSGAPSKMKERESTLTYGRSTVCTGLSTLSGAFVRTRSLPTSLILYLFSAEKSLDHHQPSAACLFVVTGTVSIIHSLKI
jgi:hypothetical protein